jgi:hypothetical protein
MLKKIGFIIGALLILMGVLGFLKGFTPDGKLFGLLQTNLEHNVLNLGAGILAILSSLAGGVHIRRYFLVFGVIFLTLALIGFIEGKQMLLGMMSINQAGNIFHLILGVLFLLVAIKNPAK